MACVSQMLDGIWFDQSKVLQEEYNYHVYLAKQKQTSQSSDAAPTNTTLTAPTPSSSCVAQQIAQARERIHKTLQGTDTTLSVDASAKLQSYETENAELRKLVDSLVHRMAALEARLGKLESKDTDSGSTAEDKSEKPAPPPPKDDSDSDSESSDEDLFGSDSESEDEETKKRKEERLAAYSAKKAKKPVVIAKSNIIVDIKPWDDETDMVELEKGVRAITTDGLIWGPSKLIDVAYGIQKLQISCVVEDDKVGTDYLEEHVIALEDLVQSMDVVAFNKV